MLNTWFCTKDWTIAPVASSWQMVARKNLQPRLPVVLPWACLARMAFHELNLELVWERQDDAE
jgi:hypothetical protein